MAEQIQVHGVNTDNETRCRHYHSLLDIVAIKFKCCGEYYSCYSCHEELAGHKAQPWPPESFDQHAVMCGSCKYEMTIREYLGCQAHCPSCGAAFNPGCALHYPLYFEME
ncbi:CHY zinc finger protein [Sporolactobacillus sp. THM19-2]|uniref:CHY zinc finger protein n=1 Tax=Sporolactobacillus sp. THM19-2 TaxID=2511171 RepID=UPI001021BB41|nr:CHY zinc finger protein [Sporolactobacillus sp. THM19-2]RYL94104.1 hypothetical protein EWH91_02860 [Sporolactobacillus sp. THM19-2]